MKKGCKLLLLVFLFMLFISMAVGANAEIFINEILANGVIEPDSEWVELFNNASSEIDLAGFNITEQGASSNFTLNTTIPANGFIVLVENFTLFNSTFPNVNKSGIKIIDYGEVVASFQLSNTAGNVALYNSSGSKVDNISYSSTTENISIGRFPDGSVTITTFTVLTPGNKNDNDAPIFNRWINPSKNNSFIAGLFNLTVNITDLVYSVNISLINFNSSNFTMNRSGDLFYFLWNTTLNAETIYNITIFFNDTLGFSNTGTLFNITVDNTKPSISNPFAQVNARNFINPGFSFQTNVTATDANLVNVTCFLNGTTVGFFDNSSNNYSCIFTAPSAEDDFEIIFTAIDKANNTNSTAINFTTKYTTAAALTPKGITVADLNQSDKLIEVNATFKNIGNNPIFDSGTILSGFSSDALTASVSFNICNPQNINASQSCNVTFNVTVKGGSTGTHTIFWNANWTDSNFTKRELSQAVTSSVTISSNPKMALAENASTAIQHGKNTTLIFDLNSTGNVNLEDVNITFIPGELQSSFIDIAKKNFTSIPAGKNETFNVTVSIPKHANPGNYTGIINITASSLKHKTILIIVEVPGDSSWTSFPTTITSFKKTNFAGELGNVTINNTGNIGQNYSITFAGDLFFFIWNRTLIDNLPFTANAHAFVERNTTKSFAMFHKDNGPLTSYAMTITITSTNTSATNISKANLTRDDASPFVNITAPLNNSFVMDLADFNVAATDLNLSRLEFYINNTLVFESSEINFTFKWNTTNSSFPDDVYNLKVIAFDSANTFNQSEISVTVNNTDSKPIFSANIPDINITEDIFTTLNLSLFFKSIDGDSLRYNFSDGLNISVDISNATQTANLTPNANFSGASFIIFTAIDTSNQTASSNNVTINVININDAPRAPVLSNPLNNTNVKSATGRVTLIWNASLDVDNDAITYFVFFSNDSSSVTLSTIANATTASTGLTFTNLQNKTYFWNVIAGDNSLNSSRTPTFQFALNLDTEPNITFWQWNNTLIISSSSTTDNKTPILSENKTLAFNLLAVDVDNDNINFTWFLNRSQKSTKQNFTFDFTNNFTSEGFYNITLIVQDNNSNEARENWNLTIKNLNRKPSIAQIPNQSIIEESFNVTLNLSAFFSDEDAEDRLAFLVALENASQVQCSISNSNLTLIGAGNFSGNGSNAAKCIILAFDGTVNSTNNSFFINVANINDIPSLQAIGNLTAQINKLFFFDANATDPDNDVLNYSSNSTIFTIEASTGIINFTPASSQVGNHTINITANDSSGLGSSEVILFKIIDIISATELTSPVLELNETERQKATNVTVNQSTFGGIDFENNTLNFSGVIKLEDAFNISNGSISVDANTFRGLNKSASLLMKGLNFTKAPLIFTASGFKSTENGSLCPETLCTNKTYDKINKILRFKVAHFTTFFTQTNTTNGAPMITSTPVTEATERGSYTYDVEADDPDGDTLIFSLIESPSGMSIGSTGLISWTPTSTHLGTNNVTVLVNDSILTDNQSFQINVSKGPKLIISDLDVKVDGKTDKNVKNNTRVDKEAKPGSEVEFKVKIENLFSREEDLDIEDIEVDVTIEDIDDGDDLEEEADEFDLKAGKDKTVEIGFDIPLEVDEEIFDVVIKVEGKDENNTKHEILFKLGLEVEKANHEIRIIRASVIPSTIKCQRTVSINTEIINTGSEDEGDVTLEIFNADLGINSLTAGIELDEGTDDNRFTKLVTALINKDISSGIYPIAVNSYYDSNLAETKTLELVVQECELVKEIKEEVKEEKPKVAVIRPEVEIKPKPEPTAEIAFFETDGYLTLLAISVVLFIGTAVFVVGAVFILLRR